jgi:Tetratricopeptide repeat
MYLHLGTTFLLGIFLFSFSTKAGFSEQLSDAFCGDETYPFSFGKIKIDSMQIGDYYELACNCNCSGDGNSIVIIDWDGKKKPRVILNIESIRTHQILKHITNGFQDIAVFVRKDPNESYSDLIADTLTYKNGKYINVSKSGRFELLSNDDTLLQNKISILLKDKLVGNSPTDRNFKNIENQHNESLLLFKSGKKLEAAQTLLKAVGPKPWTIDNNNVGIFNDLGFFLEEAGQFQDAVDVLADVIAKFPDRTPAYLNLADAYTGLKNNDKAKENYKKYRDLMTKAGKQAKIPARVIDAGGK